MAFAGESGGIANRVVSRLTLIDGVTRYEGLSLKEMA